MLLLVQLLRLRLRSLLTKCEVTQGCMLLQVVDMQLHKRALLFKLCKLCLVCCVVIHVMTRIRLNCHG